MTDEHVYRIAGALLGVVLAQIFVIGICGSIGTLFLKDPFQAGQINVRFMLVLAWGLGGAFILKSFEH